MTNKTALLHTQESKERIVAGLSWDAREGGNVGLIDRFVKKDSQHDLDITCYFYNDKREFVDFVGAEATEAIDETGKIYHSGDDMTGAGGGDDEYISAELAELPSSIHGIVFLVEVRSQHNFCDVSNIECRLADGMSDQNLFEAAISDESVKGKNAWVFCSVFRSSESMTGWMLNQICNAPPLEEVEHWGNYLAQFVD